MYLLAWLLTALTGPVYDGRSGSLEVEPPRIDR